MPLRGVGGRRLMERFILAAFWVSSVWLGYTYIGYPILIRILSSWRGRLPRKASYQPSVSIIVAVHNEETVLAAKLNNLLGLTYPADKRDILVVSDASTDSTDEIVQSFASCGVRLIRVPSRQGKHFAQQMGIESSSGEIIVFTDAAPVLHTSALTEMLDNFADSNVGSVSSEDRVIAGQNELSSEGVYIDYEMKLRRWESRLGSVTGLSGSFFSVRRELCSSWSTDRSSDFFMALETVRRGYRAIMDPQSIHYYAATQSLELEFRRKERTILNGLGVMFSSLDLLNVFRYRMFSIQLFSHKICRWCGPICLIGALAACSYLAQSSWLFAGLLVLQLSLYGLAIIGMGFPRSNRVRLVRIAAFFVLSNLAIVVAWLEFFRGRNRTIWEPTQRQ